MKDFNNYYLYVLSFRDGLAYSQTEYLYNSFFKGSKLSAKTKDDLLKVSNNVKSILVFSSNISSFQEVLEVVNHLKPEIIVHIGDHIVPGGRQHYNLLANETTLYLRQHNHPEYKYSDNTLVIPLGYTNFGFNKEGYEMNSKTKWRSLEEREVPVVEERKFNWGWNGELKTDREEMLLIFSKDSRNNLHPSYKCSRSSNINESIDVLLNSLFALQGRGFYSLNCFRLYEASICGSIPIVVGSSEELEWTFKYENNPPWIFSNRWEDAYEMYLELLQDPEDLQRRSSNVLNWWNNRIGTINEKIINLCGT